MLKVKTWENLVVGVNITLKERGIAQLTTDGEYVIISDVCENTIGNAIVIYDRVTDLKIRLLLGNSIRSSIVLKRDIKVMLTILSILEGNGG